MSRCPAGPGCAYARISPGEAGPIRKGLVVASTEVERFSDVNSVNGVDVAEVPSAAWGWSRINYRSWHITGLVIFVFLLAMLRGNHVGHIEDWFLIGFAALVLFVVVRDLWGRRRGWIR